MSTPVGAGLDYEWLVQDDRIHGSLHTDPRIFADEMDRIFHRGWVFVGHASEVPRPGDFVTRRIGVQPVLMVRGGDGQVSVFVNRCRHRGTMLCPGERGHARTFACPYHGWTYDLDGRLIGVPYPGGYASLDRSEYGLEPAPRVDSYRGFVFASFAAGGKGKDSTLPRITSFVLQSTTIPLGTAVPYTVTIANPGAPQPFSWIQPELVQPPAKTTTTGTGTQCPDAAYATIPTGSCTFEFYILYTEQHNLKPGAATLVLRLLQQNSSGKNKEFDRVSVPVTLTN